MIFMGPIQPIKFYNPMILLMPAEKKIKSFLISREPDYLEINIFKTLNVPGFYANKVLILKERKYYIGRVSVQDI